MLEEDLIRLKCLDDLEVWALGAIDRSVASENLTLAGYCDDDSDSRDDYKVFLFSTQPILNLA
jgi:hypothetical protein